ncbi:mechanosensitive ion channel family protein [Sphingomonas sp. MMS24-J45]|uniref:mechanosensitive ion channel family protein n=1 Tax=Sphingomonas sp. MMS24-J45 TaxID=3238806 RepID=UPI00384EF0B1
MSTANKSAAILPPIKVQDVDQQLRGLFGTTIQWFGTHWLQILIAIGVASVLVIAFHFIRRTARNYCTKRSGPANWLAVLARTVEKTGNIFMVVAAVKIVSAANFAATPAEVAATINFLWTLVAWFQVAIWARELILGGIENRTHGAHYSGEAISSAMGIIRLLVSFAVFAIAFIVVLDNLGVNVTGLVAGLGVGGIAIGLAAQGIFADLFAALAIIFDRPFRRGDTIAYDTTTGEVESIGLKSTRIRAATGEERIIANKQLLEKEIQNITQRNYRRCVFTLGLVQWTPVETLKRFPAMLKEVVESCDQKFVRAGFMKFGDSSYDFDLEFDSEHAGFKEFFDARHLVGVAIIERMNAEGISLAYPTQTGFTAAPEGGLILPYSDALATAITASTPAAHLTTDQSALSSPDEPEG